MMECQKFRLTFAATLLLYLCATGAAQVSELSSTAFGLAPGMVNERGEEVVGTTTGFAAVLTLDDTNLRTLVQRGRVEVAIPRQLINSVDSVIIKRPIHFKDAKAKKFANAQRAGRKLILDVDRSVIERIDYQPVELKVYESGFSSVVLNYDARSESMAIEKPVGNPATDSPLMTVKLKSGNGITGRIRGMQKLKIDSSIGNISVDFARTRKISVREDGELGIELINGDLISGEVEDGEIVLINRWSDETIRLSDVSTLIVQRKKQTAQQPLSHLRNFPPPRGMAQRQNTNHWTSIVVPYQ